MVSEGRYGSRSGFLLFSYVELVFLYVGFCRLHVERCGFYVENFRLDLGDVAV